jgi:hypothetical protein
LRTQDLSALFTSPDYYPLEMDFARGVLRFVPMSPDTYRESVFLDKRTRFLGDRVYLSRLDDVLFAASTQPPSIRPIHYILHTTFCCSTLLARYFELLDFCFVLKEPLLLTQLALTPPQSVSHWSSAFDVGVKLLTRTYAQNQMVVIKPHEPCNALAQKLLEHDQHSTITFLITPLSEFLVAILKSKERRAWVRSRLPAASQTVPGCKLANVRLDDLSDPEAAAFLWLVNRFICGQLSSGVYSSRVLVINGNRVADSPEKVLPAIADMCEITLQKQEITRLLEHPAVAKYSKDLSKAYTVDSRRQEIAELEERFAPERDSGMAWAKSQGIPLELPQGL